jgi:O-antigen ligase
MIAKNYFAYLLMFYVASTLVFSIGSNIVITRTINIAFLGSFLVYFLANHSMKLHIHKFLWFYVFFTIFSLFSALWSIDITSSVNQSFIGIVIAVNLIAIYNICRHFKIEIFILYGMLLGAVYNYVIAFDFISYSSQYTVHFVHRFVGTFNNPNVLAIYMILCVFSSIVLLQNIKSRVWRSLLIINIPIALYVIILTASKKGFIFSALLLVIYLLSSLRSKRSFVLVITILVGGILLFNSGILSQIKGVEELTYRLTLAVNTIRLAFDGYQTDGSTAERIYLIQAAYDILSKNFGAIIFGTGAGTFFLQNDLGLYAHNNYMEIIANLGLIGLSLFYSIYYFMINDIRLIKGSIKYAFLSIILVLLLMDITYVSYSFKPIFFIFIFIVLYSENMRYRRRSV